MGWADRIKDSAKGFLETEAGQEAEQALRRKAEDELDAVFGSKSEPGKAPADGDDANSDASTTGDRP